MKLSFKVGEARKQKADALIIGVYEGLKGNLSKKSIDYLKSLGFKGELGKVVSLPSDEAGFKVLIVTGLGRKLDLNEDNVRVAASAAVGEANRAKFKKVVSDVLGLDKLNTKAAKATAEGLLIGSYKFDKYMEEKNSLESITVFGDVKLKDSFEMGKLLADATNFAREIVNEPGNVITPVKLADLAVKISKQYGFSCNVFDEKKLKENKMVGILAVGNGSANPPRFIHMTYKPRNAKKRIVLVGKGVTFDSGGLNIKPEQYMKTMKADKAAACAVLGIMKAVGELKPDLEVHGLIPTVENMPDGKAYRPDDILVFKNGKSVEVHSTDAEGRLILADALIYGSDLKPDIMIDMATLTGACVVALGPYISGLFTDDDKLAKGILDASKGTGEKLWRMPLDKDLEKDIKGDYSDIQNVGKIRYGGAITAGLFLKNFVGKGVKSWAHLDIAGPAFISKPWKYYESGATGQPVRTIVEFLSNL